MLNGRVILFGILCIFFVAAAFGQEQSDPNIITVTEKIDLRELNATVKELSKTVGELSKTVGELSETVGELKTTVTRLDERTKWITNLQYVILAGIFGPLLLSIFERKKKNNQLEAILAQVVQRSQNEATPINSTQVSQDNESDTASTEAVQENQSVAASTNPPQVDEGAAAPAATSQSGFPEGEELLERLKSYSHATKEKD